MRKANDYARQRLVQQMEATDKRIANMKRMKLALIEERKKNQRLEWIANETWKHDRVRGSMMFIPERLDMLTSCCLLSTSSHC